MTPLGMKKLLLAESGVDCLIVLKSTHELLSLSPYAFLKQFLTRKIQPQTVVEGDDFNFGAERSGSMQTLQEMAGNNGFDVVIVAPKEIRLSTGQKVRVSSTIIRYMLESGHAVDAAAALGRPYRLTGLIITGKGKGRQLGFPTANMQIPKQIIPAQGVYAGLVEIGESFEAACTHNEKIPAVFSIGQARTFGEEYPLLIEAHLLKNNIGNLAGKWMSMDFLEYLRSQRKFKTEKELSEQIAKDCEKTRQFIQDI